MKTGKNLIAANYEISDTKRDRHWYQQKSFFVISQAMDKCLGFIFSIMPLSITVISIFVHIFSFTFCSFL